MDGPAHVWSAEFAFARYEHGCLKAELDDIRAAADKVGRLSPTEAAKAVKGVRAWLALVVYPKIDRVTASTRATRIMRIEHDQIEQMGPTLEADVEALRAGTVTHERVCEIRAHLLGLESMVRAHIARQEEFLRPELEAPTEGDRDG
jgi:hypothetical protein